MEIVYETVCPSEESPKTDEHNEEELCGYYPNQESAPAYVFNRSLLQFTQEGVDQVKKNVRMKQ